MAFGGRAACMQSALQDHKVGFKPLTLDTVREILPDTVMQQVLADNTCKGLLHLVRLSSFRWRFRQKTLKTSLSWTDHFCTGGVWWVQIMIFICKHNNCTSPATVGLSFWQSRLDLRLKRSLEQTLQVQLWYDMKGSILLYLCKRSDQCKPGSWGARTVCHCGSCMCRD